MSEDCHQGCDVPCVQHDTQPAIIAAIRAKLAAVQESDAAHEMAWFAEKQRADKYEKLFRIVKSDWKLEADFLLAALAAEKKDHDSTQDALIKAVQGADAAEAKTTALEREAAEHAVGCQSGKLWEQYQEAEAISEGRLKTLNEKAEEARREWARAENAEAKLAALRDQCGRMAEALKGGYCWDCTAEDGKTNHRCWETERDEALSPESEKLAKVRECERKVLESAFEWKAIKDDMNGFDGDKRGIAEALGEAEETLDENLSALAQARAELDQEGRPRR